MAKPKRMSLMTPEERLERQRRYDETTKLLEDRIAYHRRRTDEEREREERRLAEPGFFGRLRRRLAA